LQTSIAIINNITTARLELIATTLTHLRCELERPGGLSALLGVEVPQSWPPGQYDRDAMEFFKDQLEKGGVGAAGWYGWYALRRAGNEGPGILIGCGGYFGPPDEDGVVEVGFSVIPELRQRGYATEIVSALVAHAFSFPGVQRIHAHAAANNAASIRVLVRNGFRNTDSLGEASLLKFHRARTKPF
jgi:[ribosomal protein S5]-alanine N-acetyltransferase